MPASTQSTRKFIKLVSTICALFYLCSANAQQTFSNKALQLVGGYSRHGSGDMNGIVFGTDYIQYYTHRFSLNYNLRATINDTKDLILVTNNMTGRQTDASVRFTTAGVQLGVSGGLSLVRNLRHEFMMSLGGFGRYQSASNGADGYGQYYPQITGQPTILIGYDNRTPQETFSFGGILQFQYNYTFKNKMYTGMLLGFQTDTNGDAIPQLLLTIGKRL